MVKVNLTLKDAGSMLACPSKTKDWIFMNILLITLVIAISATSAFASGTCEEFYSGGREKKVRVSSPTAALYKLRPIRSKFGPGVSFVQPKGVPLKNIADAINAESQKSYGRDAIFAGELFKDPGMHTIPTENAIHRLVPRVDNSNFLTRTQQTEYFQQKGIKFADRAIVTVAAGLHRLSKGYAAPGTRPDLDTGDLLKGYWTRAASKSLHVDPIEGVNAFNPEKDARNGYGYHDVYSPARLPDPGGPLPAPLDVFDTPYGKAARFIQPAGKSLADVLREINTQSLIKYQRRAVDIETLPNDKAMNEKATVDIVHVVVPRVLDSNFKPLKDQEEFFASKGLTMSNRSIVSVASALFRLQRGFASGSKRPNEDEGNFLGGMWTRSPEGWVSFQPGGLDAYAPERDAVGGYGHEGIFAAGIVR